MLILLACSCPIGLKADWDALRRDLFIFYLLLTFSKREASRGFDCQAQTNDAQTLAHNITDDIDGFNGSGIEKRGLVSDVTLNPSSIMH